MVLLAFGFLYSRLPGLGFLALWLLGFWPLALPSWSSAILAFEGLGFRVFSALASLLLPRFLAYGLFTSCSSRYCSSQSGAGWQEESCTAVMCAGPQSRTAARYSHLEIFMLRWNGSNAIASTLFLLRILSRLLLYSHDLAVPITIMIAIAKGISISHFYCYFLYYHYTQTIDRCFYPYYHFLP